MIFSRDHEDRVKYWLTEAACQPLPDKVSMVTSKPNSKYNIALLNYQELYTKIVTFMNNYKKTLMVS